jgi:hypothetical protein
MGMDGDQGQFMHLRWAPASYRQVNPAEQQRLAQYMQAQSMAAQARQQAIQRPNNVNPPQPVSPQQSPMAAYYSPHMPAVGTPVFMSLNQTPAQPPLISSCVRRQGCAFLHVVTTH